MRFAGDRQRLGSLLAETRHRFGIDRDDARLERTRDRGIGVGDQDRRQHLRKLNEIDRRSRDRACGLWKKLKIRLVFCNQRQNGGGIDIVRELDRHRFAGIDAERTRPAACQDEAWLDRCGKCAKRSQSFLIESLDRKAQQRLAAACDDDRPSRSKFGERAAGTHVLACPAQDGTCVNDTIFMHKPLLKAPGWTELETPLRELIPHSDTLFAVAGRRIVTS